MRILLVADMRSPHSVGWVHGLTEIGVEPLVVSSRRLSPAERATMPDHIRRHVIHEPADALSRARSFTTLHPYALDAVRSLARHRKTATRTIQNQRSTPEGTGRFELPLELCIARQLGREVSSLVHRHNPDLVHALRIPFEGISVTSVAASWPTAISIWGQDLARQAPAASRLAKATRRSLANIHGLHADCQRDIDLAREWGAPADAINLVAAGNMGYDQDVFNALGTEHNERKIIFCPRGPGSPINYTGFLRVANSLTQRYSDIQFVAARLSGNAAAEDIRKRSAHPERIILTGNLSVPELADIYRRSLAVVSPSVSDGTPNSVLEGMSCGAIPLVGDIAPLRELLGTELPRSLFDPLDEDEMEQRLIEILDAPERQSIEYSEVAQQIATSGWSRGATFSRVQTWYEQLTSDRQRRT